MQDEANVKGYALLSYVTPLKRDRSELWTQILQRVDDTERRFFGEQIYANHWYPRKYLHALMNALHDALDGNSGELRELGAMAARFQVHVIYRMFLKLATPALVFRRASSVWSRQSTVGSFAVVEEGDNFLVGELEDPDLPVGIPEVMAGWSDTIIAMLGRTPYPTRIEQHGLRRWRFRVSWVKR